MSLDEIKEMMIENINSSVEPFLPVALNDERLEDAFKFPVTDDEGYAERMPCIMNSYGYGKTEDDVKILTRKSASITSNLYSKYLDEEAIVWDATKNELFLYMPDFDSPVVAFKGSCWVCAKSLNLDYSHLNIYDVYKELKAKIEAELNAKNE